MSFPANTLTGYNVNGVDLINIFQLYQSGLSGEVVPYSTTINGTLYNFNQIFQSYSYGPLASSTKFLYNGRDINTLYQKKSPFSVSGASANYTIFPNLNNPYNGYYAVVFTGNGSITFNGTQNPTVIMVGGGGSGGGGELSSGAGGSGGGGGGGITYIQGQVPFSGTYTVSVGLGGLNAFNTYNQINTDGGSSTITNGTTTTYTSYGGGRGYSPNLTFGQENGGNGGGINSIYGGGGGGGGPGVNSIDGNPGSGTAGTGGSDISNNKNGQSGNSSNGYGGNSFYSTGLPIPFYGNNIVLPVGGGGGSGSNSAYAFGTSGVGYGAGSAGAGTGGISSNYFNFNCFGQDASNNQYSTNSILLGGFGGGGGGGALSSVSYTGGNGGNGVVIFYSAF